MNEEGQRALARWRLERIWPRPLEERGKEKAKSVRPTKANTKVLARPRNKTEIIQK